MAYTSWYERSEYRRSGEACMIPISFHYFAPADFWRSTLVTVHSWWIQSSLAPNTRCWSQIIFSMESIGRRFSAISFSTPRKPMYWAASSGYLSGSSFQRNFEDNGADIACCGESRPLLEYLSHSCLRDVLGKEVPRRRAIKAWLWSINLWDTVHGLLT